MKFTKLLAATFAALAMFSCSKETMTADNRPVLNPGDARVVLNLNNGTTTYATQGDENAIRTLAYALYDGNNLITAVDNAPADMGSVDLTISATDYANITDPTNVTLCVLANGSVGTTAAMPATLTDLRSETTKNSIKDADVSTKGLVASRELTVDLTTAVNNTLELNPAANKAKLTRGVARFWVKSATTRGEIVGAAITINNINEGVTPFSTPANAGVAGTLYNDLYTVPSVVPADQYTPTGSTEAQEAAFYAYPTASGVSINVKLKNGDSKTVTVDAVIEANKNYSITITPKVVNGRTVVDNVEIDEWNLTAGDDIPVDFKEVKTLSTIKAGVLTGDIKAEADGSITFDNNTDEDFTYTLDEIFTDFPTGVTLNGVANSITTYATNNTAISSDNLLKADIIGGKLRIMRNFNSHEDTKYEITVNGSDGLNYVVKFQIKGDKQPKNLYTTLNGVEIMTLGVVLNNEWTYSELIAAIEEQDGATFAEKTKNYVDLGGPAQANNATGRAYRVRGSRGVLANIQAGCPAGTEAPTVDQLMKALFNNNQPSDFTSTYGNPGVSGVNKITFDSGISKSGVTMYEQVADPFSYKYWTIADTQGNTLYFPGDGNMNSSDLVPDYPTFNFRIVLWTTEIQHRSTNAADNTMRCVKKKNF